MEDVKEEELTEQPNTNLTLTNPSDSNQNSQTQQ